MINIQWLGNFFPSFLCIVWIFHCLHAVVFIFYFHKWQVCLVSDFKSHFCQSVHKSLITCTLVQCYNIMKHKRVNTFYVHWIKSTYDPIKFKEEITVSYQPWKLYWLESHNLDILQVTWRKRSSMLITSSIQQNRDANNGMQGVATAAQYHQQISV